jgi:hypothetical protein
MTLGNQGWDAGVAIAKDFGKYDPTIVPLGAGKLRVKRPRSTSAGAKGDTATDSPLFGLSPMKQVGLAAALTTCAAALLVKRRVHR